MTLHLCIHTFIEWTTKRALDIVDNARASTYPHLRQAFNDSIDQFGPNDFFVLQKSLKEDCANPPLRAVIGKYLRLFEIIWDWCLRVFTFAFSSLYCILYAVGFLFHVEWCIRQAALMFLIITISCNITSIAYNQ